MTKTSMLLHSKVGSDSVSAEPPASSPTSRAMSMAQPAGDICMSSGYTTEEITDSDSNEPQENYGGGDQSGTMVQDHQEGEGDDVSDVVFTQVFTLWMNGFSMNDGPLETLDKQKNVDFIEAIKRAESPREFKAHLRLIRHQDEDFHEPFTPFQGLGRTLGRSACVSAEPSVSLVVDPPAPTTSIRLRLADGTRIVSRFNTHHTVRHPKLHRRVKTRWLQRLPIAQHGGSS